ncbi:MAG: Myxococcus cysteine-rich repeat protein, partial [Myxococcaceae bacterium]|nr:Myxococcus cysteine-rich repeat protein [Myxococcaceae bacterium]
MKSRLPLLGASLLALLPFTLLDCGGDDVSEFPADDAGGDGTTSDADPGFCDGGGFCGNTDGSTPLSTCGDGLISDKEGCDDGNAKAGDGCSDVCQVEAGWVCPVVALRCEAAKCGDGIVAGTEECESPSADGGTGCSATCKIQPGFDCDPLTKVCAPTACGNAKVERGESCEDGNAFPFDGCFKCQKEPSCTNGVCAASCGDGQRFGTEACDDGNTRAGDGCSPTCTVETGYACTDVVGAPPATIDLPILARDFIGKDREINGAVFHTDFNRLGGSGLQGIVATQLDAQN